MFPNHTKGKSSSGYVWLMAALSLAVMLVVSAVFAFSSAQAQTPTGDYCIEGIVIDWEEEPLPGWAITVTDEGGFITSTVSAPASNDDDDDPDLEEGEFEFTEVDLYDNGAVASVFTVSIESRPGWEGVTPTTLTVPIEFGMDDCARVRFKMRQIYTVTVYKIDADHNGLNDWNILAQPGKGNLFASPDAEDTSTINGITGTAIFTLTPGSWVFSERPPDADDDPTDDEKPDPFMPVVPPTGQQELEIDSDDPFTTTYTVVFKNEFKNNGCIRITKTASVPPLPNGEVATFPVQFPDGTYAVGGWGFRLLAKDGTVVRQGVTGGDGVLEFDRLPFGPYIIQEEDRAGWNEITARELDINVEDGNACYEVNFVNEQDESGFCIEGRKIDAYGDDEVYGIAGWTIEIEPLDDEGFDPEDVLTDGRGEFRVDFPDNDYRVPGGLFEVCEEEIDGWDAHTPLCQIVRLPEWPGACVQLEDFVNQQVGHSESMKHDEMDEKDFDTPEDYGLEYVKGKGYIVVPDKDDKDKMSGPYAKDGYEGPYAKDGHEDPYAKNDDRNHDGMNRDGMNQNGMNYDDMNRDGMNYDSKNYDGKNYDGNDKACQTYHIVQKGETLFKIGELYDASPQAMVDANPETRDHKDFWIYEGQKICIP